jgi:pyruvate/2-oxoglutarate dehydrogenase complex dihydrolipoamide dehydrogenase (E3) component
MFGESDEIRKFDYIIIGAGRAGISLARDLADAGKRTALIERKHIGGSYLNEGCTPSKTMAASAEVMHLAKRAHEFGIQTGHVRADMTKVRQRKRDMVESFITLYQGELVSRRDRLTLFIGHARFVGDHQVEVLTIDGDAAGMTAPSIIIDAGCRPYIPDIAGLHTLEPFDTTSIMEIDRVPERLIVLGGGKLGVEFSQMFQRFGSKVTLIERQPQVMPREDVDVARAVVNILREDGIRVLLASDAVLLEKGSESIRVTISSQGVEMPIEGSDILLTLGRIPNSEGLDLEVTGVKVDAQGFIQVDEKLETSAPGIYAVGDIKGGPRFTHVSRDDFRVLRANLLRGENASIANRIVPYAVFMDPQLGRVGIGEDEAKARGLDFKVARIGMATVARAVEIDRARGFMKAIVDAKTDRILGFCCLGVCAGEIMSMVEIAMMGDLPFTALRDAIFAHPTLAESLNGLFESID